MVGGLYPGGLILGGGGISIIISLLVNRRAYFQGVNMGFYGMC